MKYPNYLLPSRQFPIIAEHCIPWSFEKAVENIPDEEVKDTYDSFIHTLHSIFQDMKDCGINVFINAGTFNQINHIFQYTEDTAYNLPAFVCYNYAIATPYSAISGLAQYVDNQRVLGWNLRDEPPYYLWGDVLAQLNNVVPKNNLPLIDWNGLSMGYLICRQLAPNKLAYWTLAIPESTANNYLNVVGSCLTYENYLNRLAQLYRPPLWSYDVYPIIEKQESGKITTTVRYQHFYNSLRMMSAISVNTGSPFWAYGMIMKHVWYDKNTAEKTETNWSTCLPLPTSGVLRFELFSALACGAQGLVYYRYGVSRRLNDPSSGSKEEPEFYGVSAACSVNINQNNNGQTVYEYVANTALQQIIKRVNAEVQFYKEVFLNSVLENAYQIYESNNFSYGDGIPRSTGLANQIIVSVHAYASNNIQSPGVLLTTIVQNKGTQREKRYVIMVSHDAYYAQVLKLDFIRSNFKFMTRCQYSASTNIAVPAAYNWETPSTVPVPKAARNGYYVIGAGEYIILEVLNIY